MAGIRKTKNYIQEIYVEDLFGYYTYTIPKEQLLSNFNPLLIIYGDNGSGKTTILRLIFHLLSATDNVGHKSKIASIRFSKIKVTLGSKIEIIAERPNFNEGPYDIVINDGVNELHRVTLLSDNKSRVTIREQPPEVQSAFDVVLKYIQNLNISIFFLTDERELLETSMDQKSAEERKMAHAKTFFDINLLSEVKGKEENDELILAVKNLENWIRNHVIKATRKGERDTNTIYYDIVKRINESKKATSKLKEKAIKLKTQLEDIRKRSASYHKYGLVSNVDSREIENTLIKTSPEKLQVIYSVLEPYIEGLRARLDSLQEMYELLLSFTNNINSYFTNKTIAYDLSGGITVKYSKTNEPLSLSMLSSGERQLMLLICNIITASEEATIFIIDEPEISLNIKWQRKLGTTLLEFAKGRNVQFILATHSIELLAGHKNSVVKLDSEKIF